MDAEIAVVFFLRSLFFISACQASALDAEIATLEASLVAQGNALATAEAASEKARAAHAALLEEREARRATLEGEASAMAQRLAAAAAEEEDLVAAVKVCFYLFFYFFCVCVFFFLGGGLYP